MDFLDGVDVPGCTRVWPTARDAFQVNTLQLFRVGCKIIGDTLGDRCQSFIALILSGGADFTVLFGKTVDLYLE
jgi:hypothetical protein